MGRLLLLILGATALLQGGCTTAGGDGDPAALAQGHGDLTCVTCHQGALTARSQASVPSNTCTGSGCHADGGPGRLTVGSVTFEHRNHGGAEPGVDMACAGCHTHPTGGEPIYAGTDACSLCHAEKLDGAEAGDCRTCHNAPDLVGFTSQGVAVPHEGLPWIQGECVRCHFDVSEPSRHVSTVSCASCHEDLAGVTAAGIGQDLHPDHTSVGCTSCHAPDTHHIVAMSSAVDLECADCHVEAHGIQPTPEWPEAATCNACHQTVHAEQQQLVMGTLPHDVPAVPSEKFLDGLTCRSCHVTSPDATLRADGSPVAGSGISCSGCHRTEYRTVLRWWDEGTTQRQRLVAAYLGTAEAVVGAAAPDTARALLAEARSLLTLVEVAGGEHNLPLAHRMFSESLTRAQGAYALAGRSAPSVPDLGRRPSMGLCTYCHYRLDDNWRTGSMDERFHREVLGLERLLRDGS